MMKYTFNLKIFLLNIIWISAILFSAGTVMGNGLELQGFVKIDKRMHINEGLSGGDTFGKLRLEAGYGLSENIYSSASAEVRYYDLPMLEDFASENKLESDYPLDILLWEAYIEISPFISENLDIKIGKQRIVWGAADKFNPTDNLNPNDFTDMLDFGAKVPSFALKASYYLGDNTITGVWIPFFEPALFPKGGIVSSFGFLPGRVEKPKNSFTNGMFGLKFSGTASNLDYSLSYFKGFDNIPIPIEFDPMIGIVMGFPEVEVLGFDFAGEFASVGFWVEAAMFFPEEIILGADVLLSDDPYLKYTIGLDYTFKNGVYLEGQYIRGLSNERGVSGLTSLLLVRVEKKFFNNNLTLALTSGLSAKNIDKTDEGLGTGLMPEISYRPISGLELKLRVYILDGKKGNSFGNMKDHDQISFSVKQSF